MCTRRPSTPPTSRRCSTSSVTVRPSPTCRAATPPIQRRADRTGMACTIVSTSKSHGYQLRTTYSTDVARDSVIMHTQYVPLTAAARHYQLYVRLDATAGGNGGGGSGNGGADSATVDTSTGQPVPVSFDTVTTTNAVNRDYAVPTYLALHADRPFTAVSSGFVGTPSDGLTELDSTHALSPTYTERDERQRRADGAGQSEPARTRRRIALGFGTTQSAAVHTAAASSAQNYLGALAAYESQWQRYDNGLRAPAKHLAGTHERAGSSNGRGVLRVGECREGERRQDVPRSHCCLADKPVGSGGLGGRSRQYLLRFVPRDLLARPVRGVDRAVHRRRHVHGEGRCSVPVPAPATARRVDAEKLARSTARWLPTRSTPNSTRRLTRS